jgi:RHS repeat-associated protein
MCLGKDVLGSVRSVSGEHGTLEERYEYDAFGKPYQGDLGNGMSLGYTGKPYDSATGLYNYGYRDYQPEAARFATVDPARDGSNWFAYVNNDPVNWVDPWGLSASDRGSTPIITGISGVLPLVGKINTGNGAIDSLLAGGGDIWNTIASAVNVTGNYIGDLNKAAGTIITMVDDLIPDKYSLTGSGLREDLYVAGLFAGMNPGVAAEVLQHTKNLSTVLRSSLTTTSSSPHSVNFVADKSGQIFPVPKDAIGPVPVINSSGNITGTAFTGGSGKVSTMRIMDPKGVIGASPAYPQGYITYSNSIRQAVSPYTGETLPRAEAHFPLRD